MVSYAPGRIIIPWPTEQGPLPFDCLVGICEYLQPEDLVRFALACRVRAKHQYSVGPFTVFYFISRSFIMLLVREDCGGVLRVRYKAYQ